MRRLAIVMAAAALVASSAATAAADTWETEDLFGQGLAGPTVAVNGAKINRGANGVTASVTMPTPEPGSYIYPDSATSPTSSGEEGHPEAFSLWVFVFFNPQECAVPNFCGPADLINDPDVVAGAFNAGGHLAAGPKLTMSGRVTAKTPSFGGPNAETIAQALALGYNIADAEIHIAVAPHGGLAPELLPAQIKTPVGNPSHWWLALFN
ncbi:MAG: hypothetical protein WD651_02475 [Acidimicrobiia bacterium]